MSDTDVESLVTKHVKKTRTGQTIYLIAAMLGSGSIIHVIPTASTNEASAAAHAAHDATRAIGKQIDSIAASTHETSVNVTAIATSVAVLGATVSAHAKTLDDHESRLRSQEFHRLSP